MARKENISISLNGADERADFDTALPVSLASKTGEALEKKIVPRTSVEPELSPYVIHLSHDEEIGGLNRARALLDELDLPEDFDEVSLIEEDPLLVTRADLASQLREPDVHLRSIEPATAKSLDDFDLDVPQFAPHEWDSEEIHLSLAADSLHDESPLEPTETLHEERAPRRRWVRFRFGEAKHRAVAAFTILSFSLVAPLHAMQGLVKVNDAPAQVMETSSLAIDNFLRGAHALEDDRFAVASADFDRASEAFAGADEELNELRGVLLTALRLIPQTKKTHDSVRGLLGAGQNLSLAAANMSEAGNSILSEESTDLVTKLHLLDAYVSSSLPHVQEAEISLASVDPDVIPDDQREQVALLLEKTPQLARSMEEFREFSDALKTVLGDDRKMRYLVAFQNNAEIRPTGGFIGSFAEIDVYEGEIVGVTIPEGGTYDLQGQLSAFVAAPEPMQLINPRWEFHDSNWFPDFPTSAEKLLWFYEKAGGPTVDGVIAINATLMPELLGVLGEVEMPEYGRTIDRENFLFETQKIVEHEYEQYTDADDEREEDAPKKFIGDLAPKLLERMKETNLDQSLALLEILSSALLEKDTMLYFRDNALQSDMQKLGWTGEMKQAPQDALMIVNTNLGGKKTDTVIDQEIDLDVSISDDGRIVNTLRITKNHRGLSSHIFEGENNVDYLRVYVPEGSTLLHAEGFEIPDEDLFDESDLILTPDEDLTLLMQNTSQHDESGTDIWDEQGRTVFGNWIQTKPGEMETIEFVYELPFTVEMPSEAPSLLEIAKARVGLRHLSEYSLFIQKQPGVLERETRVRLHLPEGSNVAWQSREGSSVDNDRDAFLQYILEHK